LLMHGLANP